jgi:diguanylate cyclase (GGDEF)-like protein
LAISTVRDDQQRVVNHVGVYTDITRIPHAETQMERLAHHDALTELPNRLLLNSRLAHTLERTQRGGGRCAVMYLDLDNFKPVNDQMGHEAGDELLKGVAKRLRLHLRDNDTVARIGGDEFVVVLEDLASPEGAEVVARAIIERMTRPFALSGEREAHIGCSVGIAMFPKDGTDGETLLRHADAALYVAKAAGRGTFSFFSADGPAQAHPGEA